MLLAVMERFRASCRGFTPQWRLAQRSLIAFVLIVGFIRTGTAQTIVRDVNRASDDEVAGLWLPYVFDSETFGFSVGIAGVISGYPSDSATLFGTFFGSANSSYRAWLGAYDLRVPLGARLFLSPDFTVTEYGNVRAYIDGNSGFPEGRAGSHGSDSEDYVTAPGWDGSVRLSFRYVLPWGHGRDHIINRVQVKQGSLVSDPVGGASWNPLDSGRTYILVEPFYRNQEIDMAEETRTLRSNGIKLEFRHDNTDFFLNPSRGSMTSVAITRDWGLLKSSDEWTHLELDYSKYLGFGETGMHRQRVLALGFWISDVPTWDVPETDDASTVRRRPPYFEGSTLGGVCRMRAYPVNRFSDRSAVYYSAEYRAMPRWNPLEGVSLFGSPEVEWWQWVLFCEAGRVADEFDLGALHSELDWDVGVGLRAYSKGLVGRMDVAFSEEASSALVMIGHSF